MNVGEASYCTTVYRRYEYEYQHLETFPSR